MKTKDLIGPALDWAVAKCEGIPVDTPDWDNRFIDAYPYSTDWATGGPIIDREKFCAPTWDRLWQRWHCFNPKTAALDILGPTPLVAAMRCFVTSKLGDEVEIPKELARSTERR